MGQKSRLRFQDSSFTENRRKVLVVTGSPEARTSLRSALRTTRTELLFASDLSEVAFFCQLVILGEGEGPDVLLWDRRVAAEDLLVDLHARVPEMRVAYLGEPFADPDKARGYAETPFDPVPTFNHAYAGPLVSFVENARATASSAGSKRNERKEEWEAFVAGARRLSKAW